MPGCGPSSKIGVPLRVEVRALINVDGQIVTTIESRRGEPHSGLPGGRVERWETLEDALVREVKEETDLTVQLGRLLYVAQVVSRYAVQDANFIFEATIIERGEGRFQLIKPSDGARILPPVLDRYERDALVGWPDAPYWLGNIIRETIRAAAE